LVDVQYHQLKKEISIDACRQVEEQLGLPVTLFKLNYDKDLQSLTERANNSNLLVNLSSRKSLGELSKIQNDSQYIQIS
jgi:hypothetical protein